MKKFLKSRMGKALIWVTMIGVVAYILYRFYSKMKPKSDELSTGVAPAGSYTEYWTGFYDWIGCSEAPEWGLSVAQYQQQQAGFGGVHLLNMNFSAMDVPPQVGDYLKVQNTPANPLIDGTWKILHIGSYGGESYQQDYLVTDMPYVCSDHPDQAMYRPAEGSASLLRAGAPN